MPGTSANQPSDTITCGSNSVVRNKAAIHAARPNMMADPTNPAANLLPDPPKRIVGSLLCLRLHCGSQIHSRGRRDGSNNHRRQGGRQSQQRDQNEAAIHRTRHRHRKDKGDWTSQAEKNWKEKSYRHGQMGDDLNALCPNLLRRALAICHVGLPERREALAPELSQPAPG